MSLTIHHLNDDATFLLTFCPPRTPEPHPHSCPGAFTLLVDPWLTGSSSVLHPSFQLSSHAVIPAIRSLADLQDDIDAILISQDKPDHCNRETLSTLPRRTNIKILATPAAAKTIRNWHHFERPDAVQTVKPYSADGSANVVRIPIPAYSSACAPGEVTIANIVPKFDLTKLHNAIGITYRPPGIDSRAATTGSTFDHDEVPAMPRSFSPPSQGFNKPLPLLPALSFDSFGDDSTTPFVSRVDSPREQTTLDTAKYYPEITALPKRPINHSEKVLSVIYTPHGISPADLQPYMSTYLRPLNDAQPVTALFHCMTVEVNPRLLGGRVNNGAPGGIKLLKSFKAKHWVGIHDEAKQNSGISVAWLKTQRYGVEEVNEMLRDANFGDDIRPEVHVLGCGEVRRLEA